MPNVSDLANQIWPYLAGKVRDMISATHRGAPDIPWAYVNHIETDSGSTAPSWAYGIKFTGCGVGIDSSGSEVIFTGSAASNVAFGLTIQGLAAGASSVGESDLAARSDHQHGIATGVGTALTANSTNSEGSSASLARADHTHDLATAVAASLVIAGAQAEGSSASLARADHQHGVSVATPASLTMQATPNAGTSASLARADHQHGLGIATPAASSVDLTAAAGTSTSTVRADHVHGLKTSIAPTWSGIHGFVGTGDRIVNAGHYAASLPFTSDLGSANKRLRSVYAAELNVETLVSASTLGVLGGRLLIPPAMSELTASIATGDTTIYCKHNSFAASHVLLCEASGSFEAMLVTAGPTGATCPYSYTVTRDFDGSGANEWQAGTGVVSTGKTGAGWIELYAKENLYSASSTAGPTIVGNSRSGSEYNAWRESWAIGNLKGLYGYTDAAMGAAFGDSACSWLAIDASQIRIMRGTASAVRIANTGACFQGAVVSGCIQAGSIAGAYITAGSIIGASIMTASLLGSASPGVELNSTGIFIQGDTGESTWRSPGTIAFKGYSENQKASLQAFSSATTNIVLKTTACNTEGGAYLRFLSSSSAPYPSSATEIDLEAKEYDGAKNHSAYIYLKSNEDVGGRSARIGTSASEGTAAAEIQIVSNAAANAIIFKGHTQAYRDITASRGGLFIPLDPMYSCTAIIGASINPVNHGVKIQASAVGLPASTLAVEVRVVAKWAVETAAAGPSITVQNSACTVSKRLRNTGGPNVYHEETVTVPGDTYGDFLLTATGASCASPLVWITGYYL